MPRDAASEPLTKIAKASAQISIDAALSLDSTSSLSKLILGDFENGTGPVRRVFGPGPDGVRELFSGPTGEYFRSESSHAISYLPINMAASYRMEPVLLVTNIRITALGLVHMG